MIGYEDYNALGLPPEYAMQDKIEQVEKKVIEKLKKAGLTAFLDAIFETEEWYNAIDAQIEAEY